MEKETIELLDVPVDRIVCPEKEEGQGEDGSSMKSKCIDSRLIPLKVSYVFYFASLGGWKLYTIIFLISIGLTPFESGLIASLRTVVSTFALPLWGFLSDYTGKRKLVLVVLCLGMTISVFSAPFIARELNVPNLYTNLTSGVFNSTSTEMSPQYCSTECGNKKMFNGMLGLFLVIGIFAEFGISSFLDSNVMTIIETNPTKTSYGKQRVFGALGFALTNFIAGIAVDHFKHQTLVNYTAIFFVFLPFSLLGIPFHLLVEKQAEKCTEFDENDNNNNNNKHEKSARELATIVFKTCFNVRNFTFLVSVFVHGTTLSFKYGYLFLHMKDNMAASSTVMGLSVLAASVGECTMFPLTHSIIKRFDGMSCFMFALFVNSIRFLMLAFTRNPWLTLPIEVLHCFGFALGHASLIKIIFDISPVEVKGTMFAVQNTLNLTFATVVGSLLGGYMYGEFGGKIFFIICSVVNGVWGSVAILILYILSPKHRSK